MCHDWVSRTNELFIILYQHQQPVVVRVGASWRVEWHVGSWAPISDLSPAHSRPSEQQDPTSAHAHHRQLIIRNIETVNVTTQSYIVMLYFTRLLVYLVNHIDESNPRMYNRYHTLKRNWCHDGNVMLAATHAACHLVIWVGIKKKTVSTQEVDLAPEMRAHARRHWYKCFHWAQPSSAETGSTPKYSVNWDIRPCSSLSASVKHLRQKWVKKPGENACGSQTYANELRNDACQGSRVTGAPALKRLHPRTYQQVKNGTTCTMIRVFTHATSPNGRIFNQRATIDCTGTSAKLGTKDVSSMNMKSGGTWGSCAHRNTCPV